VERSGPVRVRKKGKNRVHNTTIKGGGVFEAKVGGPVRVKEKASITQEERVEAKWGGCVRRKKTVPRNTERKRTYRHEGRAFWVGGRRGGADDVLALQTSTPKAWDVVLPILGSVPAIVRTVNTRC